MRKQYLSILVIFYSIFIAFPLLHFWDEGAVFMKPLFIFSVGLAGLFLFFNDKFLPENIFISISIQFYLLFIILQFYYNWNLNFIPLIFLGSLYLLYKIFYIFLLYVNKLKRNSLIIVTQIFIICIELLLFIFSKKFKSLVFFPNNSIFSILLGTQFLFVLPYLISQNLYLARSKYITTAANISIIMLCYFILFFTNGRSGVFGFSIGIILFYYKYIKLKFGIVGWVFFPSLLLFGLINIKSDSSNGRLLIYKVIITQVSPTELLTGIGYGKFKAKYNQFQAEYFSKNSIDNKEALLADNTYFAFNDPFQLIIETGLIGVFILLFFVFKFYVYFRKDYSFIKGNPFLHGAYLSIICVIVSSLFSYPFQVTGILIYFIFYAAVIGSFSRQKHPSILLEQNNYKIRRMTFFLMSATIFVFGFGAIEFYKKANEAALLSKTGYRIKAIKYYNDLSNKFIKDGDIFYKQALELSKINNLDSAILVLNKASIYLYNDKSAILMGNLLQEKKVYSEAEESFKKAVYTVPKLFRNRYLLFKFYYDTNQIDKALYWSYSILNLTEKIPSETIDNIKHQTMELLLKMTRKGS